MKSIRLVLTLTLVTSVFVATGINGVKGLGQGTSSSEWVAYLGADNQGIGIHTPGTPDFTAYRALGDGTTGPGGSACSYVAPIRTFALKKGMCLEYSLYLTVGTLDEIQHRFGEPK